jgi:hypothetical protein
MLLGMEVILLQEISLSIKVKSIDLKGVMSKECDKGEV